MRSSRSRPVGRLALVLALGGLAACGGGERPSACSAYGTLRDAVRAVEAARSAAAAGDAAAIERQMAEVDRLVGVARTRLAGAAASPGTERAARAMLEAANYLEFIVDDYRSSGVVDFAITQFASRELTRAGGGAGGAPLNC